MTHEMQSFTPEEEARLLDRLVDGELDEDARRRLLLHFEGQPDRWRQCALAFLETQAWDEALPEALSEPSPSATTDGDAPETRLATRPVQPPRKPWMSWMAMAASFLLAFGLGLAWRELDRNRQPGGPQIVESTAPGTASPAEHVTNAGDRGTLDQSHSPEAADPGRVRDARLRNVRLLIDDGSGAAVPIDWPMIEDSDQPFDWLEQPVAALTPQLGAELQALGLEVDKVRHLVPVRLEDGRRGIVPVDRIQLRYVGQQEYR